MKVLFLFFTLLAANDFAFGQSNEIEAITDRLRTFDLDAIVTFENDVLAIEMQSYGSFEPRSQLGYTVEALERINDNELFIQMEALELEINSFDELAPPSIYTIPREQLEAYYGNSSSKRREFLSELQSAGQ